MKDKELEEILDKVAVEAVAIMLAGKAELYIPTVKMRTCNQPNCSKRHKGHGYCQMHLARLKRHGDLLTHYATTHSQSQSPEHRVWTDMKQRCENPSNPRYNSYGGRGIKVCKRWLDSFENFISDMGQRPTPKHSIDRIDNDRGYEPDNCRWATRSEQVANRRPYTNTGFKYISYCKSTGYYQVYYGGSSTSVNTIDKAKERLKRFMGTDILKELGGGE